MTTTGQPLFLASSLVEGQPRDHGSTLSIRRITPVGDDVPPSNQVLIEFDRPVVPLGRMERKASELPITITPQLNCKWRWIDRQALSCQLDGQDRMAESTSAAVPVTWAATRSMEAPGPTCPARDIQPAGVKTIG